MMTTTIQDVLTDSLIEKNAALVACQKKVEETEATLFSGACLEDERRVLIKKLVALDDEQERIREDRRHLLEEMTHHAE